MQFKFNNRNRGKPAGIAGKIGASLFFFVFFAMGTAFCGFLLYAAGKTIKTYSWNETSCTVLESSVSTGKGENPYNAQIQYKYIVNGKEYTSDTFKRSQQGHSDYGKAQAKIGRYPAGKPAKCYVNPANPSEAILAKQSLWHIFFIFIPLIFVAVGVGGIYGTWRKPKKASSDGKDKIEANQTISGKSTKINGAVVLILFFGVFLLAGTLTTYFIFLKPYFKLQAAKSWTQVECLIESSRVQAHSGDDGTTYSVDILYSYTVNGSRYKSNNYNFSSGSSSGRGGKQRVVDQFRKGSKKTCYINPANPHEATLTTEVGGDLFFGLIPLVFFIVGLIGVIFGFKLLFKKKISPNSADWLPKITLNEASNGHFLLKPRTSPLGKFIGISIFFVIWSTVVFFMIRATMTGGNPPPMAMTVIFALIDVGVAAGWVHSLLNLFNAKPLLIVSSATPRLGETIQVAYMLRGKTSSISNLTITIEGREEATYQRGTKSYTDKRTFETMDVINTESQAEFHKGVTRVTISDDTMHSFKASNNKITWCIKVNADIKRWPDIKEEFEIVVLPREA